MKTDRVTTTARTRLSFVRRHVLHTLTTVALAGVLSESVGCAAPPPKDEDEDRGAAGQQAFAGKEE